MVRRPFLRTDPPPWPPSEGPGGVAPVVALMMVQTQSEVFEKFGHPGDARAGFGSADTGDGLGVLIFAFLGSLRNLRGFPLSFPSRAVGKGVSGRTASPPSLHSLEASAVRFCPIFLRIFSPGWGAHPPSARITMEMDPVGS